MYKKINIICMLSFIIVFSLSSIVTAQLASDEVDVNLNVDKYAQIDFIDDYSQGDEIDLGELEGKTGVYWIDGDGFTEHDDGLEKIETDGEKWSEQELIRQGGPEEDSRFFVRSNADVDINFEFAWNDPAMNSPIFFAIYHGTEAPNAPYIAWFGDPGETNTTLDNDSLTNEDSWSQSAGTEEELHIDTAVYITEIEQQEAGNYSGEITITVEATD